MFIIKKSRCSFRKQPLRVKPVVAAVKEEKKIKEKKEAVKPVKEEEVAAEPIVKKPAKTKKVVEPEVVITEETKKEE